MQQRAPRLRPDQYLADSITRVGRFAKRDPRKGRDLPSLLQVLGVLAWAGLVAEAFRRARAAVATEHAAEAADADPGAVAGPGAAARSARDRQAEPGTRPAAPPVARKG